MRLWQTQSYKECQDDLIKFGKKRNIPLDRPWRELSETHKARVLKGEGPWSKDVRYGAKRFFEWLETKSYKMHVRVLLSRYRAYTPCLTCNGARLEDRSAAVASRQPRARGLRARPVEALQAAPA